jgi:sporulation protein YlmC with PRC-barrel domain
MSAHVMISILSAMAIPMLAGTTTPARAQQPGVLAPATATAVPGTDYRSAKWLSSRSIVNNNAEEIGTVSDLILDRGTGEIVYVVVKSGATMGLGGREVVVPFGSMRFEFGNKERMVLGATPEQLKGMPEYSAERWKALRESRSEAKDDTIDTLHRRLAQDTVIPSDPYAGGLGEAKASSIEGTITRVERVRTSTFGEQIVVTIELADRTTRKVAMGPSWFVNASMAAPMRGDKISVDALPLPRDPDKLLAATELRNGERRLQLRDGKGSPLWSLPIIQSDIRTYSAPYSRYLLVSDINGLKVDCRGSKAGKVADMIVDLGSGGLVFIVLDPDANFLGIGDTNHLIPWTVAAVTLDGKLRIDASKEMVMASPAAPSELSGIGTSGLTERVYKAFDVPAPQFRSRPVASMPALRGDNAWSAGGPINVAIAQESLTSIEGQVTDLTEVTFENGTAPARALTIRTTNGRGDEVVLLGPSAYLNNHKPICKTGDSVKLEAYRTTIDGRRYWIARHVDCIDGRVVLLQGSDAPVWAQP